MLIQLDLPDIYNSFQRFRPELILLKNASKIYSRDKFHSFDAVSADNSIIILRKHRLLWTVKGSDENASPDYHTQSGI
ncbi:hypothetical protein KCP70_14845 [Salmonella enterica subsp. enterica]|nr:hypothetical protein KCP70_14845 [Salmonella enterica subsp. enterica]